MGSQTEHLRHSLARAKEVFIEDPRMMANRIVQLGEMLAEAGKPEPYADLLDGLEEVATRHPPQAALRRDVPALLQHPASREPTGQRLWRG